MPPNDRLKSVITNESSFKIFHKQVTEKVDGTP